MLPDLSPEQKMLYMQHDMLRKEFSELLERKNEMLMHEQKYLTALYLNAVGKRQHQKYCLTVEIKMLLQRIHLLQSYINQNKYPDKELVEMKIKQEFEKLQFLIAEENTRIALANKYLTENSFLPPHIAKKIKEIYILIVKKLHPDINPNATEEEKDLFLKAQAAYDMSNLDVLEAILLSMNMNTPVVSYNPEGMKELVAKLNENVSKLKAQIEELDLKFPFSYRKKLSDEKWIETEQESMDKDIELLTTEKKKYSEYLLLMDEWKPQLLN